MQKIKQKLISNWGNLKKNNKILEFVSSHNSKCPKNAVFAVLLKRKMRKKMEKFQNNKLFQQRKSMLINLKKKHQSVIGLTADIFKFLFHYLLNFICPKFKKLLPSLAAN